MATSVFAVAARRAGWGFDRPSRRRFLKASVAAGAGLLAPTAAKARGADRKRVLIVGAGLSGLACAVHLKQQGHLPLVVEARERVGGRVLTFRDFAPGRTVEGGGELVGSNHPLWVALAQRFGLEFGEVTEPEELDYPLRVDGRTVRGGEADRIWAELEELLAGLNEEARKVSPEKPWEADPAFDRRSLGDWLGGLTGISPSVRRLAAAQLEADMGVPIAQQSYLGLLTQIAGGGVERYWSESEVFRCRGGNDQLAAKLAAELGEERILLKTPVTRIEYRDDNGPGVRVAAADARSHFLADAVVLTVPPSVWGRIAFEPALPEGLGTQMGRSVKYLSQVSDRFWLKGGLAPVSLSDGDVQWTWESTDGQPGAGPAVLNAFSGGRAADRTLRYGATPPDDSQERRSPNDGKQQDDPGQRDARYRAELEPCYPGFGAAFQASRFMAWPRDPWSRGGYSCAAPGQITKFGAMLQQPFGSGRLWIGGESTCYAFIGYMEGALQSGLRCARGLAAEAGV